MRHTNIKSVGVGHYFSASYVTLHNAMTQQMKQNCQSPELDYSRILHHVKNNVADLSKIKAELVEIQQGHADSQHIQFQRQSEIHQCFVELKQQPTERDWYDEMNHQVMHCIQSQVDILKKDIISRSRSEKYSILLVIITCFLSVTVFLFLIVSGKFIIP